MASIIGKGLLEIYSQTLDIQGTVSAASLYELLKLPESYRDNIIAVRGGKVLMANDIIENNDEIVVFVSVMGG